MIRHPRTTPLCTLITWMLVVLMVEPQSRVVGQESRSYVRALEVLLAPPAASSRTPATQSPILMAAAQTPLLDTPAGGDTGNNIRAAAVDPNLLLNLTRTPITLTNGHEMLGLSFFSDSNHNYVVEFRDDIGFDLCNQWQPLTNAPHNYGIVFTESQATNRFFRLRRIDTPRAPLFALLAHDTGTNSLDGITSDPTITGMALEFTAGTELQAALNNPAGPFTVITNLGSPRYFRLTRDQLATLNGGLLPDGSHTLHLRAMNGATTLGSFDLPFTLDTTTPIVTVSLAPAFDSPPLGDGRTALNPVILNGQTEPGTRLELLATTSPGGASTPVINQINPDANGSFVLTNIVLVQGTNQLYFRALDAACNETIIESQLCWYGSDCAFPDNLDGWQVAASPTVGIPGSVTVAPDKLCTAIMTEGDSFLVALSRDFLIPTSPSVLSLNYEVTFDTTTTQLMRDAFEVALVDAAGRPLTFTIQGEAGLTPASVILPAVLPPSPDALFNHTDGESPFVARGSAVTPIIGGARQLSMDVSHLAPGSAAKLIIRLVNNDGDGATSARIKNVSFQSANPNLEFNGSSATALSSLLSRSPAPVGLAQGVVAPDFQTAPSFATSIASPVVASVSSSSSNFTFPIATNISINSNYVIEVFASNIRGACALAYSPENSQFGEYLYVTTDPTPVSGCSGQASEIYKIAPNGTPTRIAGFPNQWLEASPWWAEYPPLGSRYGDQLYVSANDLAGDPCAFFDGGGTVLIVNPMGGWTNLTGIGTANGGPRNPYALAFCQGTSFGDTLFLSSCQSGDVAKLSRVNTDGGMPTVLDLSACNDKLVIGRGPWEDLLVYQEGSGLVGISPTLQRTNLLPLQPYCFRLADGRSFGSYIYVLTADSRGRKITRVTYAGEEETFAEGFGPAVGQYYGHVARDSMEFSPRDSALYFSDWVNNRIYRITPKVSPADLFLSLHSVPPSAPADSVVSLSGLAGYTGGTLERGAIVNVTINGTPVEALDPAGNFFSTVTIRSGRNIFTVTAEDSFGAKVFGEAIVAGTPPNSPADVSQLNVVSASVVPDYGRTSFNEWTKVLYADLALRNAGTYPIRAPFYVGVTRISDPSVKLLAPDGVSADGIPYYDYSGGLANGALEVGHSSFARALAFHNPNKVQFTYDLVVLGQLNQTPAFTTTPAVEAIAGKPYTYAFNATDPDRDLVTYSLATGPAGLNLNSQLQTLNWSPLATNLGTHDIRLRADDGKGGIAEQHYLISVINQPSNRPPVITSIPRTQYRIAQTVAPVGYEPTVVLPYDGVGFRYREGNVPGFESPDFDDSNFAVGNAGFGSGGNCAVQSQVRTHWNTFTTLLVRGRVFLPKGSRNVRVAATIDNDMQLYFNGVDVSGYIVHGGCPTRGEFTFTVPDSLLRDGPNLLAVRALDYGSESYFEMQVSADIPVGIASYIYDVEARDPDNDVLVYSLVESPTGMVIEPFTGLIRWGPTANQIGTHSVTVQVTDGRGGSATQIYHICVLPAEGNHPPLIVSKPGASFISGQSYATDVDALDPDGDPVSYSLEAAPSGMTINSTNGIIQWEPSGSFFTNSSTVFSDGNFNSGDWDLVTLTRGNIVSMVANSPTDGGNPSRFRSVQTTFSTYAPYGDMVWIIGFHRKLGAIYRPQESGEIFSVDFGIDTKTINASPVVYDGLPIGPALIQNGKVYTALGANYGRWTDWRRKELNGLRVRDFVLVVPGSLASSDPSQTPDFSTNGAPIEFGFCIGASSGFGTGPFADEAGVDNWAIQVNPVISTRAEVIASDSRGGVAHQTIPINRSRGSQVRGTVFEDSNRDQIWNRTGSLLISSGSKVVRVDAQSGALIDEFISEYSGGLLAPADMVLGPDNNLYISSYFTGQIKRYSATTGQFLGDFASAGGLRAPSGLVFGPDGHLYVSDNALDRVLRYDGTTGAFLGVFGTLESLSAPFGLGFDMGGNLCVVAWNKSRIMRFTSTGASLGMFAFSGAGGGWRSLAFDENRRLYVTEWTGDRVLRFDGQTGQDIGQFVPPGRGGLDVPFGLSFGPDRNLYVASLGTGEVLRYDGSSGAFLDAFVPREFHLGPAALLFVTNQPSQVTESTLPDWTVYLDFNGNRRRDLGEPETKTDAKGQYSFSNLPEGAYTIRVEPKGGWITSSPAAQQHMVSVTGDEVVYRLDFGNERSTFVTENHPPSFISTSPPHVISVGDFSLHQFLVDDPDGDSLTFDLVAHPEGMLVETNSGVVAWRPSLNQLGTHEVILRVQDGRGGVALQSWQITVTAPNSPPFITTFPPGPAVVGLPYRYSIRAQDPESQPLTFALATNAPVGLTLIAGGSNTALISWTPALAQLGTNPVEIIVRDSEGAESRQIFGLEVVSSAQNRAPSITSTPRIQTRVGGSYAYVIEVADPDGDPVTVTLVSVPSGMVVTNSPELGFQQSLLYWPAAELGSYTILLRASDGRSGTADQQFTLNVASSLNNQPPLITSLPLEHATAGQTYDYQLTASDPDGDAVTWRVLTGPVGMSLDSATGRLIWIPTLEQMGTNAVVIEATDTLLATATQTFSIEVGCLNRPPQITSVPPTAAQTGDPYLYAPRGNDPDGDRLTWSLVLGQFPTGMTIDRTNGLVRWTPTTNQVGGTIVSVRVTDERGGNDTQTFTLYTANLRANHAPIIVTTPPRGATVGRPYSYNLRATDSDGDTLTLQSLVALPAGATFIPSSEGQGLLSWTPQPGQQGQQEFILTARDPAGASASQRFFVTVRSNQAPVITSTARTNAVPGVTYRYDVSAFDPDGDALTYAFTSPIPTGMTMDALGRITWTPSLVQTGSFSVTAAVSDPFAGSTDQSFTITVAADSQPPIVSLTVIPGTTDSEGLPTFDLNQQVRIRVTAADNVGVAEVQLTVSSNPVALSGETGFFTSTEVGRFPVVATARDAGGNLGIATNTLRVVDRNATNNIFVQIISPVTGATLTAPAHIVATITNAFDLQFYRVDYARADQVDLNDITANPAAFIPLTGNIPIAAGTKALNNTVLATFDPTLLLNDAYLIRVYAEDVNGLGWYEPALIGVSGNLKFGEFRLEFTDLAVPLAGIPITIGRVYDSRDSRRQGDFGYGWSLGAQDAQIRETLRAGTMFNGSRVYLNTPDGRRVGFTAYPELIGAFGFVFVHVKFRPDPGVFEKLEINGDDGAVLLGADFLGGLGDENFNPDKYRLTTKDGTVYEYDQRVGLQRVTDLNANRLDYTRDGILHYPAGSATPDQSIPFIRDAQGRITQIIDLNGKALRYSYDGLGDLRSFADQVTNITRYAYSASRAHFLTNIVDPLGRSALSIEYDSTGRLKTVRDANGNPISQDFDVDSKSATFTDGNGTVIHTRFDDNGNEVMRRIDGVYTNYFAYDANNNLLASTNGRGFSTNFTYDARGNITSISDSLSNRTTIAYSAQNKPIGVTNALGQVISLAYNSSGQLTQVVNNAGFKTSVSRDGMGRVASLTDATGTNTTLFDYNGGCACGKPGKVINPDGSFKITEYNSLGQVTREVNELGAEKLSSFDDTGKLLWTRDPLTNYTQFFYRGPLLTNVVDALGRSTRYEYDSLNRTNKIIDAENGVVEFRYDDNGNRTHVIDALTNVTTFVYDSADRLKMQIDPLGHTNFFGYDAAGNRTEAIDRNGRKRTFAYDAANRMTNELWWEGTNVVRSIVFGFNELGVQTLAADPAARYTYSYDSLNRLERMLSQSASVPDFTLLYTYTALGQVETVTDNYGVRVGSSYDDRNRLAQRTWQGPGVDTARVDFAFDVTGNRTRTDRYADLAGSNRVGFTTNAHNHAGIVTNITHAGPTGAVFAKYDYNFDAAYQIRNWTINNQPSAFEYDRTGQLTNALNTAQPNENFRFDANGNRVGAQSGGSYVVGRNNQVLSDGTNRYAYDPEGNMTSRSNTVTGVLTTYQFDHRNRLVSVLDRNPGGVVTQTVAFVYDAMNRRLSKTVNGPQNTNVVRFLYNGDDSWADLDGTNAVIARYLHGARIDELLARQRASDGRGWYLTDHLGTVRDLANAAGAVVAHVDYSSFGQVLGVSNSGAVDRFLFTGRELDGETGLYFYRARCFSPTLGRFLSQDPLEFNAGDFNLYRYANNDALRRVDPFGTESIVGYAISIGLVASIFAFVSTIVCDVVVLGNQNTKEVLVHATIRGSFFGLLAVVIFVSAASGPGGIALEGAAWNGVVGAIVGPGVEEFLECFPDWLTQRVTK